MCRATQAKSVYKKGKKTYKKMSRNKFFAKLPGEDQGCGLQNSKLKLMFSSSVCYQILI